MRRDGSSPPSPALFDGIGAYPDAVFRHDDELVELKRVVAQDFLQPRNHRVNRRRRAETKQNHAGMRPMLEKNQRPEVPVVRDENPALEVRDREDFGVW